MPSSGQLADAHGEVEAFLDEVGGSVGDLELDLGFGIALHELADRGCHVGGRKEDRRPLILRPDGSARRFAASRPALADLGEGRFDPAIEGATGIGRSRMTRRAAHQIDADAAFQGRERAVDRLQGASEVAAAAVWLPF